MIDVEHFLPGVHGLTGFTLQLHHYLPVPALSKWWTAPWKRGKQLVDSQYFSGGQGYPGYPQIHRAMWPWSYGSSRAPRRWDPPSSSPWRFFNGSGVRSRCLCRLGNDPRYLSKMSSHHKDQMIINFFVGVWASDGFWLSTVCGWGDHFDWTALPKRWICCQSKC